MKLSTRVVLFALPCLLASPILAQTQIGGGTCNSSTLNGTYELLLNGRQFTAAGTISKIFQGVGTATFDGLSKITFTMTGNIVSTGQNFGMALTYSGTYSLQSNCSGSIGITSGDPGATFTIESYNQGKSFALIGTDSTYAYNGSGTMQPIPCPTTLMGVHEFSATGDSLSGTTVTSVFDVAGVLTFDGMGGLTANWSQASGGGLTPVTATGTYSFSSTAGCLVTATLTDTASNKYALSLSIYTTAPDFAVTFASPTVIFDGTGSAAQTAAGGMCTAAAVNGTYEVLLAGRQISNAGNVLKLIQGAGAATFDGVSKVSFSVTSDSVNGTPVFGVPLTYSGTYTLQPNCQGTVSITAGDTATFALVAYSVNATTMLASAFVLVGNDATYAFNGGGSTQPATCSLATLSGGWPFSATGNSLSGSTITGVVNMAGLFTFDGQGNVAASWATSSSTNTSNITATGTYTVTPSCLGTISLTDTANNLYALSVSITGTAAGNFAFKASTPMAVFSGSGHAAFVNPGQAVDNAASFTAGTTPPGSVFTVFGSNLATGVAQPSNIPLLTTVLTTSLTVNGELAPIFYVNPTQINAQMPVDIAPGLATVIVKNGTSTSNAVAVVIPATGTPGIVVYGTNRAVVVNQDSSVNSTTSPAKVGDVVVAYFTGGGPVQTSVPLVTGARAPGSLSPVTGAYSITVNGKAATVNYIGLTPLSIGLYQANFVIPQVAAGDHPLAITIAGQVSNKPLITVSN
jgi:uncharacterized protein (TIGR03437 family)